MEALLSVLYVVLLVTAGMAGASRAPGSRRPPVVTAVAFVLTAVPSLLQLTVAPGLLQALRRDRAAILDGQVWRLATSFGVQDSGWAGLVFNLVALAFLGTVAERLWGQSRWVLVALAAQAAGSLWGLLVQPVGAGTSLVNFGLAGSLAAAAVLSGAGRRTRLPGAVSLAVALVLLALTDIHGGAALTGALTAAVLLRRAARRGGV